MFAHLSFLWEGVSHCKNTAETLPSTAAERNDAHRTFLAPDWSTAAVTGLGCSVAGPRLGSVSAVSAPASAHGHKKNTMLTRSSAAAPTTAYATTAAVAAAASVAYDASRGAEAKEARGSGYS